MNKLEQIENAKLQYEKLLDTVAKQDFIDVFNPIFDKYPNVQSFSFTAYTPYFNDGDACEYSVNSDEYSISVEFKNGEVYDGNEQPDGPTQIHNEIAELASGFSGDMYEKVFDDHVLITFSKDNVVTEEYEHD